MDLFLKTAAEAATAAGTNVSARIEAIRRSLKDQAAFHAKEMDKKLRWAQECAAEGNKESMDLFLNSAANCAKRKREAEKESTPAPTAKRAKRVRGAENSADVVFVKLVPPQTAAKKARSVASRDGHCEDETADLEFVRQKTLEEQLKERYHDAEVAGQIVDLQ